MFVKVLQYSGFNILTKPLMLPLNLTRTCIQNVFLDSSLVAGAQLRGWKPPLRFFKNRRNCPDFAKKGPDCGHLWVKFSIEIVGEKTSNIFTAGYFFHVLLMKC